MRSSSDKARLGDHEARRLFPRPLVARVTAVCRWMKDGKVPDGTGQAEWEGVYQSSSASFSFSRSRARRCEGRMRGGLSRLPRLALHTNCLAGILSP